MKEILILGFASVAMAWGIHMVDLGLRKTEGALQFLMFLIASGLILTAISLALK